MNRLFFYTLILLLITGCSVKSVNFSNDMYALNNPQGTTFDCKCDYNQTKAHSGTKSYSKPRLKSMANEAYEYAVMSFNTYSDVTQIKISDWKREERFESSKGFGADVYSSTNGSNEMVIAFRGTDGLMAINDHIFANLYINWFSNGQFSQADEIYKHVLYKYHPNKITTTGHSLGGGLALRISLLNKDVDAYVFDSSIRTGVGIGANNIWGNKIISMRDSGEMLALFRHLPLFKKLKKNGGVYRYNFLGGNFSKEHNMQRFMQCMYIAGKLTEQEYSNGCK